MTEQSQNNIVAIVPSKTDKETAEEFKKRLVEAYRPILALGDEIMSAGFSFQIGTGPGPLGKQVITMLKIVKEF